MENQIEEHSSLESMLDYANILLRWIWLPVLIALIAGFAAYYIAFHQPRVYESSTLVMVSGGSGTSLDNYSNIYMGEQLAKTYSLTMSTKPIIDTVSERLGYRVQADWISVEQVEYTQLIRVKVKANDPNKAADIANTLVTLFNEQVTTDQTSRYAELKADLEKELANLDDQIETVNGKLALLDVKYSTQQQFSAEDLVKQAQLEEELSQYQYTRSYLLSDYQKIKYSEAQYTSTIIQKDPAIPEPIAIEPQPMQNGIQGAIIGFFATIILIFVVIFLQDEIRDPEEITRRWGVPVLAVIASYNNTSHPVITVSQPRAPVSESFRSLRTNLQFSSVENPLKKILVTSASPSDGKTSIAANLAAVLAQGDREVLVIDSDLRRPRMHKIFQVSNRIGLSDYFIRPEDKLAGVVKRTNIPKLSVITSGSLPPNPSELLSSSKMLDVLKILEKHFDTLIMDPPPLLAVTDALVLAPRMDGVILIMNPHNTKRGALKHAIEQLKRVNANLLGIVLNNVQTKGSKYYYNRDYYYGKKYGKTADDVPEVKEETRLLDEQS